MDKKSKVVIGKATIQSIPRIMEWLQSDYGKNYIIWNWNPARDDWKKGEQIGFYNKQNEFWYHEVSRFYDGLKSSFAETHITDFKNLWEYLNSINQSFSLYIKEEKYTVFGTANNIFLLPSDLVQAELYTNYENLSISQIKAITSTENMTGLVPAEENNQTLGGIKSKVEEQKTAIEKTKQEIEEIKKEKERKIEEFKRELERKMKNQMDLIAEKMNQLEEMKNKMEKQLYVLESEIYAIRCYTGETIHFTKISSGKNADINEQVIIYQKIRFLDEELGKFCALYGFGDSDEDFNRFEDILKCREDLRELFAPGYKSVSFVRCSHSGTIYERNPIIANTLKAYKNLHGSTIGIIIRNGENVYMGWADEEKISVHDDNIFYHPNKVNDSQEFEENDYQKEEESIGTDTKERVSRYFIYATLQGIIDDGKLLQIPEKAPVLKTKHVIISFADGWLEDNRFGFFSDIVDQVNEKELQKGDMVLTTMHITRDDAGMSYSRSTVQDSYNNNRGRGEKNRTHDVSLNDCTVYPINLIDKTDIYTLVFRKYPYVVEEKIIKKEEKSSTFKIVLHEAQGPFQIDTYEIEVLNNNITIGREKYNTKKTPIEEIAKTYCNYYQLEKPTHSFTIHLSDKSMKGYCNILDHVELLETEKEVFISEEKQSNNWQYDLYRKTGKKARSNMEIRKDEYLNLTYLNSVWVKYAIANRKVGTWCIGREVVDYAKSIQYLNKALEYLLEREKEEEQLIRKYMDLPDEWQVILSEWKLKNDIHILTDTKAKRFAKEFMK